MTATVAGLSGVEEGQGAARPAICTAGVLVAEMAWGVDLGTSVLEGSDNLANWATDISGTVGRGGGGSNKVGEVEVSSAPLLRAGVVVALSQAPGADGNSDCPSPPPRPHLLLGHHWQGTQWQG